MPAPFYHGSPPPRGPESLSEHICDLANAFSSAAGVLSDQYTILNNATNGLLAGTNSWQGQGATSFSTAWQAFGKYMQQMQKACEDISNSLTKFANKVSDIEAQQVWDILLTIVGGVLTVISFAAAIAEFGLNPFVDGIATFFSGFTEQEGSSVVNAAEEITQADSQTATELQLVENELTVAPTLNGSGGGTPGSLPDAVSQVNLDNMTEIDALIADDSYTLYSGGNRPYQNPINTGTQRIEPPGLGNELGQSMLDECDQKNYIVSWSAKSQQDLAKANNALGDTSIVYVNGQARILIQLSPDADPAVLREEMLHAEERIANGMKGPTNQQDVWREEIKVEFQVLQEAESLNMTSKDFDSLARDRRDYINDLKQYYNDNQLPWPPPELAQYINDPPKPPSLP